MVLDGVLMLVCFVVVVDTALCLLDVDWQSLCMLCFLPFILFHLSGFGFFLGLSCVETGQC